MSPEGPIEPQVPAVDVGAIDDALAIWDRMQRPGVRRSTLGSYRRRLMRLLEAAYGRQCLSCKRPGKGAKRLVGTARPNTASNRLVLAQREAGRTPILICRACAEELRYKEIR